VAFIGKEGRWSAGGHITGAAGPVMCRLSPWMPLIIAPEAVIGRLLGSISPGTRVDMCGWSSRCSGPTIVSCDASNFLKDA
jgi:hypothetical protein